jgi:hypothetical protein
MAPHHLAGAAATVQRRFVFSQVDKAAQNFAIFCRTHYVRMVLADLANPAVYSPVPAPPAMDCWEHAQDTATTIRADLSTPCLQSFTSGRPAPAL